MLLRFAHAAVRVAPANTEVFTLGTRLDPGDPAAAAARPGPGAAAAGRAVPGLERRHPARRVAARLPGPLGPARHRPAAVVVIASDGWERGDAALLGEQMARLRRLAHRVVWVNPHKGKSGYAPLTGGMLAALPHIDDLVAGTQLSRRYAWWLR